MTPYRVTAPIGLPVSLAEMKAHLRVDGTDEDDLIESLQSGAVALLDGWGGDLRRCILPQRWAIDVTGAGPHLLPFPDADEIGAIFADANLGVIITRDRSGIQVLVIGAPADEVVTITATYALPEDRLPAVKVLVKLIVGNWYQNREAVVIGTISSELPMAASKLISTLRWFSE